MQCAQHQPETSPGTLSYAPTLVLVNILLFQSLESNQKKKVLGLGYFVMVSRPSIYRTLPTSSFLLIDRVLDATPLWRSSRQPDLETRTLPFKRTRISATAHKHTTTDVATTDIIGTCDHNCNWGNHGTSTHHVRTNLVSNAAINTAQRFPVSKALCTASLVLSVHFPAPMMGSS
ncbi:hypothetical protein EI94DRAFT_983296 [Lactarius quietus]|nr:hypothetical protein EI94DRAFT_983296 [Lactarius quietus]